MVCGGALSRSVNQRAMAAVQDFLQQFAEQIELAGSAGGLDGGAEPRKARG